MAISATTALILGLAYVALPVQANTTPTYHSGNVNSCADLGLPADTPSLSLDAADVSAGTHTYDTVSGGSIVIDASADLTEFSFSSANPPVLVVAVKAGDGYNEYDYRPAGTTGDGGLETPMNGGDQQATLSHLFFCFGEASASQPQESQPANVASLFIRKRNAESPYQHLAGAVFTVEGLSGTFTTDADGAICITGLPLNATYKVTEITPPTGFDLPDPAYQMVHVDNDGDCTSADVIFKDEPVASSSESPSESQSESPSASESSSPEESVEAATPTPSSSPEGSVEAATGSPAPSTPDTAFGGNPSNPTGTILFALILVFGMSGLAVVNVQAARKR